MNGQDVRNARLRLKLKQTELAESIGITQAYLSSIESGKRPVSDVIRIRFECYFWKTNPDLKSPEKSDFNKVGDSVKESLVVIFNELNKINRLLNSIGLAD